MSCCVNFCKNRSDSRSRERLSFYRFPSDPKQRVLWVKAARRWDLLQTGPGKNRKICSAHFITGRFSKNPTHPDYVPSIFPFNKEREYTRITQRVQRFIRKGKRAEATGAAFIPLYAPGHPPGRLHNAPFDQPPGPGPVQGQPPGPVHGQPPGPVQGQPPQVCPPGQLLPGHLLVCLPGRQQGQPAGQLQVCPPRQLMVQPPGQQQGQSAGHLQVCPTGQMMVRLPGQLLPGQLPPGQVKGCPPGSQGTEESRTVLYLICSPPESSVEQAVRMDYELKVTDLGNLETHHGDHVYSKHPHSAPAEPQPNEPPQSQKLDQSQESDQSPEPQGPNQRQETGQNIEKLMQQTGKEEKNKNEETGITETNVLSKERMKSEVPLSAESQNKQKETQMGQTLGEHPKPLLCPICNHYSWTVKSFVSHVKKHGKEYCRCNVCDKTFESKSVLDMHLRIHTGEKPFICAFCGKSYRWKKSMQMHERLHKLGFDCTYCGQQFRDDYALDRHLVRHEERERREWERAEEAESVLQQESAPQISTSKPLKQVFQCSTCSKSFKMRWKLKEHMALHTGERPHHCSLCPKSFILKKYLYVHMKVHTEAKRHSCSFCDAKFREKPALQKHIQAKHTEKTFKCAKCGRMFPSISKMRTHAEKHTLDKQRPYNCSVCKQAFKSLETAEEHLEIHRKERELKESSGQSSEHSDISVKYSGAQFLCTECGKTFYQKMNLDNHMRYVHSTERPFSCSVCHLKFKSKLSFSTHMMLHTGEKPYSCSVCQKGFRMQHSLKMHMLTHSAAKPFACTICGARFHLQNSLRKHTLSHNKAQPFSCSMCPKTYKSVINLNIHMSSTHNVGDYRCSFCMKTFIKEKGLHRHVALKHITPRNPGEEALGDDAEANKAADHISQIQTGINERVIEEN